MTRPENHKSDMFVPETTVIDSATFCSLFPFHVVFNPDLEIIQYGVKMQTMSGTEVPLLSQSQRTLRHLSEIPGPEEEPEHFGMKEVFYC